MEEKKKRKKGKKDQGKGQNGNFHGSWIEQRPRQKGEKMPKKKRERFSRAALQEIKGRKQAGLRVDFFGLLGSNIGEKRRSLG